ncbi:aminopeptidase N [Myxococcota bacterium]|nr:aminopeptidase N [Myxococcota bacterium]MBU1380269.1 aminopeptidase N [Myxococcota bacterium]MBU1496382.1 aminopeptidase N [Myxococcota bacterium]
MDKRKYLSDYRALDFSIDAIRLDFLLGEETTKVKSTMEITYAGSDGKIILDGENLEMISLSIDGVLWNDFIQSEDSLTINNIKSSHFVCEIENYIHPGANTSLEGLYKSGEILCTQCEAEGFRKITWFADRPDVMSVWTVRIEADKKRYPVLLSNGNLVDSGDTANGNHFALFNDPHRKPTYLFALVAGNLAVHKDEFTTMSGNKVAIGIYVEERNINKCAHAADSVKKAMAWDETIFGREYDLDNFKIVAVDSFNAGAMENKGLNIFNSKYVLADPQTATDSDYEGVLGVIGHEYFHNWTGNRVTCRDWFQLSLKEGLTVFRDQEFSSDMGSRAVKRIEDAYLIRSSQFSEDASGLSHPVRPESYMEINNFYTLTVYHKGAEVIRMIHSIIGPEKFRQGMDLYFERHDGHAVCCEDFVKAMEDASETDFQQFFRWYTQSGTPLLLAELIKEAGKDAFVLRLSQRLAKGTNPVEPLPLLIPVRCAFVSSDGLLPFSVDGGAESREQTILLGSATQDYRITGPSSDSVVSLLRGFSAPCKLGCNYSENDLMTLAAYDSDPYVKWDSIQRLYLNEMKTQVEDSSAAVSQNLLDVMSRILKDPAVDHRFKSMLLSIPQEHFAGEEMGEIKVEPLIVARKTMRKSAATFLKNELDNTWKIRKNLEIVDAPMRKLSNMVLSYLVELDEKYAIDARDHFFNAQNMTDRLSAFAILCNTDSPFKSDVITNYYDRFSDDFLPLVQWFLIQAQAKTSDAFENIKNLFNHPKFDIRNPNMARALIGGLCSNFAVFNQKSGEGYQFAMDRIIEIDAVNPILASRLFSPFAKWRMYSNPHKDLMRKIIENLVKKPGISKDLLEQATRALG